MVEEYIGIIAGSSGDSLTDRLKERGYKTAIIAGREGEPGTEQADKCCIADLKDVQKVMEFFEENQVKKVLIGTGHRLAFELARVLEAKGFLLAIDLEKSMLAKDKVRFKEQLRKLGGNIRTPDYYAVSKEEEFHVEDVLLQVGIPCVVKSATDAVEPQKVSTREELKQAAEEVFETKTTLLVEKFIDGGDCTVAVANDGENISDLGIIYFSKAKEWKLKGFKGAREAVLSQEEEQEIVKIAKRVVFESGLIGLVRVDFIVDDNIYVLEANSVMTTGYHKLLYSYYKKAGYYIAGVMVDNALRIFENQYS